MSIITNRKRRRTEKTVRFDIEHIVYIDTYSSMDYDRGGSLFTFHQYKINPNRKIPKLSLDIPTSSSSSSDTSSSPDSDDSIETPTNNTLLDRNKKKTKPKLTVNTSICTDGPLFFTKLSTNHFKHSMLDSSDEEDDYLVPITPKFQTTFSF